jgi:hypothetical protein
MRESRHGLTTLTLVVVIVVLILIISAIVLILVLPIKPINITQYRDVPFQEGVEEIDFDLAGNIGTVEVSFDALEEELITVDVHVAGMIGIFDTADEYNLSFEYSVSGSTLLVDVDLEPTDIFKTISFLDIDCKVVINEGLRADLSVVTNTGEIKLTTAQDVNITGAYLDTNTGSVEAYIIQGTVLSNEISMSTNTGSVALHWDNVELSENASISLSTNTGSVGIEIEQTVPMGHDVEISGTTVTGRVSVDIVVQGNVSSTIDWAVNLGNADIKRNIGFTQTGDHLQSDNYPSSENIGVDVSTNTGGIDIWAEWTE